MTGADLFLIVMLTLGGIASVGIIGICITDLFFEVKSFVENLRSGSDGKDKEV